MAYHRPGTYNTNDIKANIHNELKSKLALGQSKHEDKKTKSTSDKIYSTDTYRAYDKACGYFANYVVEQNNGDRNMSLEDARQYAADFLQSEIDRGLSAWTIQQHRSALSKLFGCDSREILREVPAQCREDRFRSRGERYIESEKTGKMILNQNIKQGHFSEKNNQEIVDFALATGLRRCELTTVRGEQLYEKDGQYYIALEGQQCKGGRPRDVLIFSEKAQEIYEKYSAVGSEKCFDKVPQAMDCHYYRGEYAKALYEDRARDVEQLDRSERYDCRGDKKGEHYDREALKEVSENLGHNRECVVLNYL